MTTQFHGPTNLRKERDIPGLQFLVGYSFLWPQTFQSQGFDRSIGNIVGLQLPVASKGLQAKYVTEHVTACLCAYIC